MGAYITRHIVRLIGWLRTANGDCGVLHPRNVSGVWIPSRVELRLANGTALAPPHGLCTSRGAASRTL